MVWLKGDKFKNPLWLFAGHGTSFAHFLKILLDLVAFYVLYVAAKFPQEKTCWKLFCSIVLICWYDFTLLLR